MCDFGVSEGIMAALTVASTATTYYVSSTQAANQANYENQMYSAQAKSSLANYDQQTTVANERLLQNNAAASQEQFNNSVQYAQAGGHALTAAGEAGVGGNSVDALYNDFQQISARNADAISLNQQWQQNQTLEEEKSLRAGAQSRINMSLPQPVNYPSALGSVLQGATSLYNQYDRFQYQTRQGIYDPNQNRPRNPYGSLGISS
jgi:hypothetical protein